MWAAMGTTGERADIAREMNRNPRSRDEGLTLLKGCVIRSLGAA
jgi:hypothetical protein